jgi:hypothetical protein
VRQLAAAFGECSRDRSESGGKPPHSKVALRAAEDSRLRHFEARNLHNASMWLTLP